MRGNGLLVVAAVRQELKAFFPRVNGDVEILLTGMGQRRASRMIRDRLDRQRYDGVISTGFAGGTRPGFQVGDLVVASEVIEAATGKRWQPTSRLVLDPTGPSVSVGALVTTAQPLGDPQAKADIGLRYGTIAVDMETAAVAQAASEAQVPWVSLRAILDPMEVRLSPLSWVQGLRTVAFPNLWGEFAGFLRAMRLASQSLANGLEAAGHRF